MNHTFLFMSSLEVTTFLVFPYYNESHVLAAVSSLWMMDYQVTYENHKHFGVDRKKSKPSPVRIFTNLSLPGLRLPVSEEYWLCAACNRYVARNNVHCSKCGCCTSKVSVMLFYSRKILLPTSFAM